MKKSLLGELIIGAGVWLALYKFVPLPSNAGWVLQLVHHIAVLVTSLAIPAIWLMYRNRDLVALLLEVVGDENTRRLPPVREFIGVNLRSLREDISKLYRSPGLELSGSDDLRELARACFRHARASYRGVDSHVPSEWMRRYRVFLEEQEGSIKASAPPSERILAVTRDALRNDLVQNSEVFRKFVKWHRDWNVLLLQIDPADAKQFSEVVEVHAVDVAFWVRYYAVIFRPINDVTSRERVIVQMLLNGDSRYRDAARYIGLVTAKAVSIELDESKADLYFRDRQVSESDFLFDS